METQILNPVNSIAEAISLGFNYVIAERNHYRGNSKGEIYTNLNAHSDVTLSHFNYEDRGIEAMYATNLDVVKMIKDRRRILNLLNQVKFSMTYHSKLYIGIVREYSGHKMVFGNWRAIYKPVTYIGADNFNASIFFTRHSKMVKLLEDKLHETRFVSSTFSIIN